MSVPGNLIHNMSVPPTSELLIAPGRKRRLTHLQVPPHVIEAANGLDRSRAFPCRLAQVLNITSTSNRAHAEQALEEATARALRDAGVAAAAVCRELDPRRRKPADLPPLLALAIVSRCSGGLFLRDRKPRLDYHTVRRVVLFYRDALPWRKA